ncbi:MAG TPA: flagellar hook-basal body complex protein FliE [Opitutaceae bacterium]
MNIGSINPLGASAIARPEALPPKIDLGAIAPGQTTPAHGFGGVLDGLVSTVDAKQDAAVSATRNVLLGNTDQLHQSVIAMQEASVAFTMMVETRNKLVEAYQELMRMQV